MTSIRNNPVLRPQSPQGYWRDGRSAIWDGDRSPPKLVELLLSYLASFPPKEGSKGVIPSEKVALTMRATRSASSNVNYLRIRAGIPSGSPALNGLILVKFLRDFCV